MLNIKKNNFIAYNNHTCVARIYMIISCDKYVIFIEKEKKRGLHIVKLFQTNVEILTTLLSKSS